MRRHTLLLVLVWIITISSCTIPVRLEVYTLPTQLQGTMTTYQADVYFLQHELPKRHEHVYHTLPKTQYEESINELFAACADLDPLVAAIRIREFVASIGDAHTKYATPMTAAAALNIVWLEDAADLSEGVSDHIYVTASLEEELVRAEGRPARVELVSIAGVPIFPATAADTLLSRMMRIISHEEGNEFQVKNQLSYMLLDPKVLYGLGIIDSTEESIPMTFKDQSGEWFERSIPVIETANFKDLDWHLYYTDADYDERDRSVLPFYIREASRNYGHEFDADSGILHLLYNRCSEDPEQPFTEFVDEAFASIPDMDSLRAVVVDLRNNSGGNSLLIRPLYKRLAALSPSVRLYAAIGPMTFSSGLMNAIELDQKFDDLILLGRPTGGRPNHYGEVRSVQLPSGNHISYSTSYFRNDPDNDDPYLSPELSVPETADSRFFVLEGSQAVGYDPVLAHVKGQLP